jgi:phosphatidylinositol alpha-mannosyltransferase
MTGLPNKLKIGLVLDTSLDTDEGVPRYVIDIGEWLRSQGHDVHYLVGQTDKRQLPNIHSLSRNMKVSFNGTNTNIPLPANRRKLRVFIKNEKFDVLHVQTPHHPLMAQHLINAAGPDTAVIGTFHVLPYGSLSRYGNRLLGIWLRSSLRRFDKMLAVSQVAAVYCRWSFGVPATVLPNVVDYKLFHSAKPLPQYQEGEKIILFLGRLAPRKGCLLLLQALALLNDDPETPAYKAVICGKGPQAQKLKDFAEQNDLAGTVEFVGFVSNEDKPRYYASADIAVFPSGGGESFGIVLLEAMAGGHAAVLAGDNPGYRSVMNPQPDLLFDPTDANALAAKIKKYLLDGNLNSNMAAWGEDYSKEFDLSVVGPKIENTYRQALRKRRGL